MKVEKRFVERKPKATYTCTAKGRVELKNYLNNIQLILEAEGEYESG